ncbi:MAG: glycosyltransferase family 39 protein [Elusimicrobiaceae bacterium]
MRTERDNSPVLFKPWTERRFFWILSGLCLLLYLAFTGSRALWDPGESRYADLSRAILDSGDWLVPRLNGVLYFEKPPLGYWLNALAMKVFGINEFAVRFVTAVSGLLGIFGLYWWASRVFSRRIALLSAAILATSAGYFAWSQIPELDMLFSLFLCGGLALFYLGFENKFRPFLSMHLAYFLIGLACLVKGIVAWGFPFIIISVYLTVTRQWKRWREFYPASGILLTLVSGGWWFVAVNAVQPDFFNFFFVGEHLQRFATKKHSRTGQFWYFIPVVAGMFFPWTAALVPALRAVWAELKRLSKPFVFMAVWVLVIFGIFSLSGSKRPPYMVPVLPPLAVLLAWWFDSKWNDAKGLFGWFSVPYAVLSVLVGAGMFIALPRIKYMDPALSVNCFWPAFFLMLSGALVWFYGKRQNAPETFRAVFLCALMFIAAAYTEAGKLDPLLSRKAMAKLIMAEYQPGDRIISFNAFWERNMQSMSFYTGRRVSVVGSRGELEFGAERDAEREKHFPSETDFVNTLRDDSARSFVVAYSEQLPDIERQAGRPLYPAPGKLPGRLVLFSNKPWRN